VIVRNRQSPRPPEHTSPARQLASGTFATPLGRPSRWRGAGTVRAGPAPQCQAMVSLGSASPTFPFPSLSYRHLRSDTTGHARNEETLTPYKAENGRAEPIMAARRRALRIPSGTPDRRSQDFSLPGIWAPLLWAPRSWPATRPQRGRTTSFAFDSGSPSFGSPPVVARSLSRPALDPQRLVSAGVRARARDRSSVVGHRHATCGRARRARGWAGGGAGALHTVSLSWSAALVLAGSRIGVLISNRRRRCARCISGGE